jgi:hypothetical protein
MPLEKLLAMAARATWRHRSWWLLGLLATIGGLLLDLSWRGLSWWAAGRFSPSEWPPAELGVQAFLPQTFEAGRMMAIVVAVFFAGLALWLVGAVAEGGLILAVAGRARGLAMRPGHLWRAGAGLLGRFIGIDTLLFLPLFFLALTLLAVGFGGLAGLVVAATRPEAQPANLLLVAGLAAAVSLPLLALMLVAWPVIMVLRALAFRAAAMEDMKARQSIGRGWRVLQHGPLAVVILTLVLAALRSLAGLPLRFVSLFVTGLGWGQMALRLTSPAPEPGGIGLLLAVIGLILALVSWLVSGIMDVLSSAAWTLSYETWAAGLE